MLNSIFDKTDKGREEIATRKFQLAQRMRSLLLVVDGRHNGAELLEKVAGSGLGEESLAELVREGYIGAIPEPVPDTRHPAPATLPPSLGIAESVRDPESQLRAIRELYVDAIKRHIGLLGLPMQLKVERAKTMEDLRAMRAPWLEAIFIAKGEDVARDLRDRLDNLLHGL